MAAYGAVGRGADEIESADADIRRAARIASFPRTQREKSPHHEVSDDESERPSWREQVRNYRDVIGALHQHETHGACECVWSQNNVSIGEQQYLACGVADACAYCVILAQPAWTDFVHARDAQTCVSLGERLQDF